jgi:Ca2+-binding RTX toxin-like protein
MKPSVPRLSIAAALALGSTALVIPSAQAAVVCTLDGTTHTLSVSNDGGVLLYVSASSGDLIVTGTDCGAISSMDTVVLDTSKAPGLRFTLTEPLGPGFTDEGDGSSELEFQIYNHYGDAPAFEVIGSEGADGVTIGSGPSLAVNLNALADGGTPDVDITGIGEPVVTLYGNGGDDVLSSAGIGGGGPGPFAGRAVFFDGTGADTLTGGDGPDVFHLQDKVADGGDTVSGGGHPDELHLDAGGTAVSASFTFDGVADDGVGCPGAGCDHDNIGPDVERVFGSPTNETFIAADGGNRINGGPGNDVLDGNGGRDKLDGSFGDDELRGGLGPDWLNGGKGADLISGGKGFDTALWFDSSGPLFVDLDGTADDGKAGEHDNALPDLEKLYGSDVSDTLIGGPGPNELLGGPGDDVLRGRRGNDHLFGDDGNDTLDGGLGNDRCVQGLGSGTRLSCES